MKKWRIWPIVCVVFALFGCLGDGDGDPQDCDQCIEDCEECRPACAMLIVECYQMCDEPNRICGDGFCLGEVERCMEECPTDTCEIWCGC